MEEVLVLIGEEERVPCERGRPVELYKLPSGKWGKYPDTSGYDYDRVLLDVDAYVEDVVVSKLDTYFEENLRHALQQGFTVVSEDHFETALEKVSRFAVTPNIDRYAKKVSTKDCAELFEQIRYKDRTIAGQLVALKLKEKCIDSLYEKKGDFNNLPIWKKILKCFSKESL